MAETEHRRGVLVDTGESFMDYITRNEIPDDTDEEEFLNEDCGAVLFEGTVWEIAEEDSIDPYEDIFTSQRKGIDEITYDVKFYNGGCGNIEAIEQALKNLKED